MRLGAAVTTEHFSCVPGRSAARVLPAGLDFTLHGVVFAIFADIEPSHRLSQLLPRTDGLGDNAL
jgi:hypothetical protein